MEYLSPRSRPSATSHTEDSQLLSSLFFSYVAHVLSVSSFKLIGLSVPLLSYHTPLIRLCTPCPVQPNSSTGRGDMRRHPLEGSSGSSTSSLEPTSLSADGDYIGPAGESGDSDTDLTDVDAIAEDDEVKDVAWLFLDGAPPPEYYLQQMETFDEDEYTTQDYTDSSTRQLNYMEDQWNRLVSYSFMTCATLCRLTTA
jgi:hypothetical protein